MMRLLAIFAVIAVLLGCTAVPAKAAEGLASWCAPTPRHCHGWDRAKLAAVPSFRYGDKPYVVRVCTASRCTEALVVSYCACGSHIIDLSPPAFRDLAPLSRGVVAVTVRRVGLPNTDTALTMRRGPRLPFAS